VAEPFTLSLHDALPISARYEQDEPGGFERARADPAEPRLVDGGGDVLPDHTQGSVPDLRGRVDCHETRILRRLSTRTGSTWRFGDRKSTRLNSSHDQSS